MCSFHLLILIGLVPTTLSKREVQEAPELQDPAGIQSLPGMFSMMEVHSCPKGFEKTQCATCSWKMKGLSKKTYCTQCNEGLVMLSEVDLLATNNAKKGNKGDVLLNSCVTEASLVSLLSIVLEEVEKDLTEVPKDAGGAYRLAAGETRKARLIHILVESNEDNRLANLQEGFKEADTTVHDKISIGKDLMKLIGGAKGLFDAAILTFAKEDWPQQYKKAIKSMSTEQQRALTLIQAHMKKLPEMGSKMATKQLAVVGKSGFFGLEVEAVDPQLAIKGVDFAEWIFTEAPTPGRAKAKVTRTRGRKAAEAPLSDVSNTIGNE